MKMHILAIRDAVANVYLQPMFVTNIGSAIRDFGDACQNKPEGNHIAKHPGDYELYHIGDWDDEYARFDVEHDGSGFDKKQLALGSNYAK